MKKTLFFASILLIALIIPIQADSVLPGEYSPNYDANSGRIKITLHKGWNLIPPVTSYPNSVEYPNNCGADSIIAYFSYSPVQKKYLGILGSGTNAKYVPSNAAQIIESEKQLGYYHAMVGGVWVYSKKYCSFESNIGAAPTQAAELPYMIKKGWNLIPLHPIMLNNNPQILFSNCEIQSANVWDAINQKWNYSSSKEAAKIISQNTQTITETNIGQTFLIKFASDCKLNLEETTISPPPLPDSELIAPIQTEKPMVKGENTAAKTELKQRACGFDDSRGNAVILHRNIYRCDNKALIGEPQTIDLRTFRNGTYCNFTCGSRFKAHCYEDGTFDQYYDELCEDEKGNKIIIPETKVEVETKEKKIEEKEEKIEEKEEAKTEKKTEGKQVACLDNPQGYMPNSYYYPEFYNRNSSIHNAATLHRTIYRCDNNAMIGEPQVINLKNWNNGIYCNYICRSRYKEHCFLDGSFDQWYDELCEDEKGNKITTTQTTESKTEEKTPEKEKSQLPANEELTKAFAAKKGNENALVKIIEFSDFQCAFCRKSWKESIQPIMKKYVETGKAVFYFRDFPLSNLHTMAESYALAARCSGEQNRYWEMHDKIFEEQEKKGPGASQDFNIENIKNWAKESGLNTEQFNSCFDSKKYEKEIKADFEAGTGFGVIGVPTYFINGKQLTGAQSSGVLESTIEEALNTKTLSVSPTTTITSSTPTTPGGGGSGSGNSDQCAKYYSCPNGSSVKYCSWTTKTEPQTCAPSNVPGIGQVCSPGKVSVTCDCIPNPSELCAKN